MELAQELPNDQRLKTCNYDLKLAITLSLHKQLMSRLSARDLCGSFLRTKRS